MNTAVVFLTVAAVLGQTQSPLPDMYRSVHEVTWVVSDLEKTVAGWHRLGFADIRMVGDVTFTDVRYQGKPATCTAKVAEGHLGDVAVQWIQPLAGNNAYSEFLRRHGTGMFSLVHRAPTREALRRRSIG